MQKMPKWVSRRRTRFIRIYEVQARVGFSRCQIYRLIARGLFPQQIKTGERAVAWLESDIDHWIAEKLEQCGHEAA